MGVFLKQVRSGFQTIEYVMPQGVGIAEDSILLLLKKFYRRSKILRNLKTLTRKLMIRNTRSSTLKIFRILIKQTGMMELLLESPELAFVRSSDGRGPMWWAHEKRNTKIIRVLKKVGASEIAQDGQGITPLALSTKSEL